MPQECRPKKIFFDATELEHPQPLEIAMTHLQKLDAGSYLYMRHRKNPLPLLQIAQNNGFFSLSREDAEGIWHILVTPSHDIDLESLTDV